MLVENNYDEAEEHQLEENSIGQKQCDRMTSL